MRSNARRIGGDNGPAIDIDELRYELGPANVEGTPREIRVGSRDRGRLLVVDRARKKRLHSRVAALAEHLDAGDVLVLNNSKRINGVLRGRTARDGQIEFRFVDLSGDTEGLCRVFPSHDVTVGSTVRTTGGGVVEICEFGVTKYDLARVRGVNRPLRAQLKDFGDPIPGFFYEGHWTTDHLNPYYATEEGSVESPLAGLHFTEELIIGLRAAGIRVAFVTLHSVGSWLPFLERDVTEHAMWSEWFNVSEQTAAVIEDCRRDGRKVVACGSTSLRALESAATTGGRVRAEQGRTTLYITPGFEFRVVDRYFTNFHQYQTSLMVLDAAFAGKELALESYADAADRGYSFFEFGDAVLYG